MKIKWILSSCLTGIKFSLIFRLPFIPDEVKIEPPSEEDVKVREEPPKESPVEPEPSSSSGSSSIFHLQPNLKFTG